MGTSVQLGVKDRMRRTKFSFVISLLSTAAWLVACSSDEPSTAPGGEADAGATVTARAACEHKYRAEVERCAKGELAPSTLESARPRYVADCVATLDLAGNLWTPEEVEACAVAVEAKGCGVSVDLLPECAPKAGALAAGAACNVNAQCATGFCDVGESGKGCGECKSPRREGDSCSTFEPACAIGLTCYQDGRAMLCGRVGYVQQGAECNDRTAVCEPGQGCLFVGQTPVCESLYEEGAFCGDHSWCAEGLYCDRDAAKCTKRGVVGDACDSTTLCAASLGCDRDTQKCAPLTFAEPGESCGGSVACREGVCGQGNGPPRCPPVVEDGEPCSPTAHMTCRAPATCIGGACVLPGSTKCQ